MLEGIAKGGPRDKVKISASADWHGRIQQPESAKPGAITRYYPGRYVWNTLLETWVWRDDPVLKQPQTRAAPPRLDNPKKTEWP